MKSRRTKFTLTTILLVAGVLILLMTSSVFGKFSNVNGHPVKEKKVTIYLAGDSTVSNYPDTMAPRTGWGQVLPEFFNHNVIIKNRAVPGRSSKSFITEGRLALILKQIHKGDYLFIQFGHNDEKYKDPKRFTKPFSTYKSFLKQYIDGARQKGATPVLVTPMERRRFSSDGKVLETHGNYPASMRELGRDEHVSVIDLNAKSKRLYQRLGPEKTKELFMWIEPGTNPNYPRGVEDNTHFQDKGAMEIAKMIVEGIREHELGLRDYLK
ncbi:rhamnogalacturonan acetylesterase [Bacillus sp. MUM 116]|uniref:rhamnogalacturonan acetylesterase n=1 Tax=Bacillus sp. MUM 116 TaxID=1678002 RepID=UPI0008F58FC6|nr:rhamnogalacturonan acetylesterase [Bacillus sp. MUM 116]OIK16167.1 rhamnogalacturonan acetylesterase [Bacillus sp. MUM 116]